MRFIVGVYLGDFVRAQDGALLFAIATHSRGVACCPCLIDFAVELDQALNLSLLNASRHIDLLRVLGELIHRDLGGGLRVSSAARGFPGGCLLSCY